MRIAVFHCPEGVSAEGIVRAFLDAGLSCAYLGKELRKKRFDGKAGKLISEINQKLAAVMSPPKACHCEAAFQVKSKQSKSGIASPATKHWRARNDGSQIASPPATPRNDDILKIALALQYFGIHQCFLRNLSIGRKGNARTLKLLKGFVLNRLSVNREMVTPAGAAILSVLCEREITIPEMELETVGFGPGGVMVSIGKTVAPYRRERVLLLETNIDDMSPQGFELLYERLFKAGALDVWVESILMKKMRPAFKLSVLFRHSGLEKISREVFRETSTLGVRFRELDRFSLPRGMRRIQTRFGKIRMKFRRFDSKEPAGRPEYEDLKRIARRRNLSFRRVSQWKSLLSKT